MQHARKMILVPENDFRAPAEVPPPSVPVSSFTNLDSEISSILSQKNLSDYDKWQKYSGLLNKYLIKFNAQKTQNIFLQDDDAETERQIDMEWEPSSAEERQNFSVVKNILQQSSDVNWDATGNVKVFGAPIGSKINALVSNLVVQNNDQQPSGWGIFSEAVTKLNIPQKYTPNLRKRKMEYLPAAAKFPKLQNPEAKKRKAEEDTQTKKRIKNYHEIKILKRKAEVAEKDPKRRKTARQAPKRKAANKEKSLKRQKLEKLIPQNLLKRKRIDDDDLPLLKRFKVTRPTQKRSIVSEDVVGGKRIKLELPLHLIPKNVKKIRWSSY